jgi:cobalt-zinc-cadmium efflux system protein
MARMAHEDLQSRRDAEQQALKLALALIVGFMAVEIVAGVLASSLALLSDAAHMLTDAAALALSLVAARLAGRPAAGALTYGLGRVEILSAQANGIALLLLAALIVYGAITRLSSPPAVDGAVVLAVALAGIVVNLIAARVLAGGGHAHSHGGSHPGPHRGSHGEAHGGAQGRADGGAHEHPHQARSLNVEGSYRHILTDLYGFVATAVAAAVIIITGFGRADAIASLLIAALMLHAAYGLLRESGRVFLEAAPAGLHPEEIGQLLAEQPGVVQVHDLHVWEVTSGFPALSAHVVVRAGDDCHERRRSLQRVLEERFDLHHTTLQVDHDAAVQPPLQIEVTQRDRLRP